MQLQQRSWSRPQGAPELAGSSRVVNQGRGAVTSYQTWTSHWFCATPAREYNLTPGSSFLQNTYLEELGRYLIREEQIQMLNQKQANLKLLGPAEKLCSESELSFNRQRMDREQSLQVRAKTSIGSPNQI